MNLFEYKELIDGKPMHIAQLINILYYIPISAKKDKP